MGNPNTCIRCDQPSPDWLCAECTADHIKRIKATNPYEDKPRPAWWLPVVMFLGVLLWTAFFWWLV